MRIWNQNLVFLEENIQYTHKEHQMDVQTHPYKSLLCPSVSYVIFQSRTRISDHLLVYKMKQVTPSWQCWSQKWDMPSQAWWPLGPPHWWSPGKWDCTVQLGRRLPAGQGSCGSHPQWRRNKLGRSCSSPAPGASWHEEHHPPWHLPGVLLPTNARRAPSTQAARTLPTPASSPASRDIAGCRRGAAPHQDSLSCWWERPHGPLQRWALPPRHLLTLEQPARGKPCQIPWGGAWLQKAVGTPALIKTDRCINCWNHQSLLN